MEHFSEQAWADFVRGFDTSEHRQMQSHLANACIDCTQIHDTWKRVHTVALREGVYTPPAHDTRIAKLEFATGLSGGVEPAAFANLTFDTFAQPALAGVRSAAATARQMLYETERLAVDLRFDRSPTSKLVRMTGQVLDKREPFGAIANAAVIVWTPKGLPMAEATANIFGEFSLQFEPHDGLKLSIQIPGQPAIRIFLASFGSTNHSNGLDAANDGN